MSLDLTDWQNKRYSTRDGRPVRILCIDAAGVWPIIGTLISDIGTLTSDLREYPIVWDKNGMRDKFQSNEDLINAKTKKEGWVNIYPYIFGRSTSLFTDRSLADKHAGIDRIACIHIEWEE